MDTKKTYTLILFIYIILWICQQLACHSTHSLIILTDSYINLFRILDSSLGLVLLCVSKRQHGDDDCPGYMNLIVQTHGTSESDFGARVVEDTEWKPIRFLNAVCTYQFRRLSVLGSFINRLFLSALLMLAALEGIQTCFHVSHTSQASILKLNPLSYPVLLVGFAFVGILMQWCLNTAHKRREKELDSVNVQQSNHPEEFDVTRLHDLKADSIGRINDRARSSESLKTVQTGRGLVLKIESKDTGGLLRNILPNSRSCDSVPNGSDWEKSYISLKSFRSLAFLEHETRTDAKSNLKFSQDNEPRSHAAPNDSEVKRRRLWARLRRYTSPTALMLGAVIVYCFGDDLTNEIADATLAIIVVILTFIGSYPLIRKDGKILLQCVPADVGLETLETRLKSLDPVIIRVENLHLWSLNRKSDRVGTCDLIIDSQRIASKTQLAKIVQMSKFIFLEQGVRCSTVQPILSKPADQIKAN